MMVEITPDKVTFEAIEKRLKDLGKGDQVNDVLKKAINEVSTEVKNRMHSETKDMYTIKASAFRKSDIKKKTRKQETVLTVSGARLGIRKAYKTRKNTRRKAAGAMIRMDGAMKNIDLNAVGRSFKGFLATTHSGHEGIFQRVPDKKMKNASKEAIQEITAMSRSKAAEKAYQERIEEDVQDEIRFRLLKHMNTVIGV